MAAADSTVAPPEAAKHPMAACLKSLLFSETLSDLTIVCHGKRIPAHRIVLYSQSSYFKSALTLNMKERLGGVISLPDDLDAVEAMLAYLYQQDYAIPPTVSQEFTLHVKIYIIADKYDLPELKTSAAERFESSTALALEGKDSLTGVIPVDVLQAFLAVTTMIYENTAVEKDVMRETILKISRKQLATPDLSKDMKQMWTAAMTDSADFAFALARSSLLLEPELRGDQTVTLRCPGLGCHKVQISGQDEYFEWRRDRRFLKCSACGACGWYATTWLQHGLLKATTCATCSRISRGQE